MVRANPADARLYVDGAARGVANQTLQLPATRHQIEIRKPGYATYTATVTPRPGLPQSLEITLLEGVAREPVPAAATAKGDAGTPVAEETVVALAPLIRTKAGQELKLVPAGEYTMGSVRREPAAVRTRRSARSGSSDVSTSHCVRSRTPSSVLSARDTAPDSSCSRRSIWIASRS